MDNEFKLKNGSGCLCCRGCGKQDNKLNTYDWLADIPGNAEEQDMVEVQFKNTRKGYYKNSNHLALEKGDIVAVEASPGHDIGTVTLTGRLVPLQIKKANLKPDAEIKRIYRKAKPVDLEKYEEAKSREHDTMIRSRKIAEDLGLQMKIGDVEYQGDGNKAIFYYIADERVDFRQLIKVLAEAFRVRIEMKQIGARQEAGRIGGIGPCGRELCCATWMKNFVSVSTSAARYQDISLNPQKLAGQCAKLKCCLNYEVDAYVECQKRLPSKEITLETADSTYYFFKADILGGTITYSTDKSFLANEATITARRAFEIINMNKRGEKPEKLIGDNVVEEKPSSRDLVEQESLTRFDNNNKNNNKKKKKKSKNADSGGKPTNDKGHGAKNFSEERGDNGAPKNGKQNGEQRTNVTATEASDGQSGNKQRGERRNEQRNERRNEQNGEQRDEQRNNRQRDKRDNRDNRDNRQNRNNRRGANNPNNQNNAPEADGNAIAENKPVNPTNEGQQEQPNNEQRPTKDQRPRNERRPRPDKRNNERREGGNERREGGNDNRREGGNDNRRERESQQPRPNKPVQGNENKPANMEAKSAENKSTERKQTDNKPANNKPANNKPAENRPAERKFVDNKPATNKPAENKNVGNKPVENKPAENKPANNKPAENKEA